MNAQKVYVITSEDGPTKIGISHAPMERCKVLQWLAEADGRSVSNYVRVLIEKDNREKEPAR